MKAKSFEYKGHTFRPVGNILGGWVARCRCIDWENKLKIDGYSYKEFYELAKRKHASCDVFEIDGKLYMPCDSVFAGITKNAPIKKCEDYERWYQ